MHDSEDATRVVGVNSTLLKGAMLLVSAFMAGVFGAFNAHYINFLEPDYAFNSLWVTLPIVAAIFGGYRTILGPRAGRLVVYLVDQLVFKSLIPTGHQLVLGVLLVAMIVFSPNGLMPLLKNTREGNNMLELENVSVRFGGLTAVNAVTLKVGSHDVVGLVGPNGAGKTTLFNAISGSGAAHQRQHPLRAAATSCHADVPARAARDRPHLPDPASRCTS
jgi:ABC-type multidrug transport system fused ATPase/permease subunit